MEAVGAKVTIATSATDSKSYSLQDFLSVAMTTSVIVSMEIPFLTTNEQFKSFKVMPRAQVSGMCRCRVDRHRSHACTYIRTCMHRCIPVSTHTCTHMDPQMHTVMVFLTNRDGFVFECNHDCVLTLLMFPVYLPTYVECSCLRERWLPHQGGPHLPHSVRHTLICVWRHRRARGEAPVHAHTYVRTYSVWCTPGLCR